MIRALEHWLANLCAALLILACVGVAALRWLESAGDPAVYGVSIVEAGRE